MVQIIDHAPVRPFDMSQQLFADYHFHPNFNFARCLRKQSTKIWEAFDKHRLDVVVVSEHSWKRPTDSYHILEEFKKSGSKTRLLPGIEVLTKEGLDVVVFGPCGSWYTESRLAPLLEPYHAPIESVIRLVQDPEHPVRGFLPHPYTRGTTGTVDYYGREEAKALATKLGGVEASNNCYDDTLALSRRIGRRFFPITYERMLKTHQIDEEFLDEVDIDFVAIGSDAHFPQEVGYGCLIDVAEWPTTQEDIYQAMTTNTTREGVPRQFKPAWDRVVHVSRSALITAQEALQKKAIRKSHKKAAKRRRSFQPAVS